MILILVVALIIFSSKKLPVIESAFGDTLKKLKKSTSEMMNEKSSNTEKENKQNETDNKIFTKNCTPTDLI